MEKITIYKEQLSRIRSMNRYYHDQFLLDVRILFILNTIFVYLSFSNKNKVGIIGKVGPRNVVTEYTLSDYEKTKPTKGKLILDQIQIMKKLGLLKKKRY